MADSDDTTIDVGPVDIPAVSEPEKEAAPEPERAEEQAAEGEETEDLADDAENSEEDLQDKPKRGKSAAKRIDQLTRKLHDMERRYDALSRSVTGQMTQEPSQGDADVEPNIEDFDDYGAYLKALAKHEVRLERKAAATQSEGIYRDAMWSTRLEAARLSIPDFNEVAGASQVPIAEHVGEALKDSERGPELLYHMATHPEIAVRLNGMSERGVLLELGRLETLLAGPSVKAASKAPPPVTPLKTSASSVQPSLATDDMGAYIELRRKQGARWAQ